MIYFTLPTKLILINTPGCSNLQGGRMCVCMCEGGGGGEAGREMRDEVGNNIWSLQCSLSAIAKVFFPIFLPKQSQKTGSVL